MQPSDPFGLYIHWPFCVSKCPYCDFNSHVSASIDQAEWTKAYVRELQRGHQETQGRTVSSIFFGGGTPSLMDPHIPEKILETVDQLWGMQPDCEITLEANPTTVEADTFANFRAAGINRLSIGVQSLRSDILRFLGRAHDQAQAYKALERAAHSFDRYSFDLIYAYENQTLKEWHQDLNTALNLARGHLSLYQLTIEPGTDFHKNNVPVLDEERASDIYDLTQDILGAAGMPAYEISNHAANGQESRHNLIYWEGFDYLGLGPGAHSRLRLNQTPYAIHQIYRPDLWLTGVFDKNSGEQKRKKINTHDRAIEILMMGLRLNKGLSHKAFTSIVGSPLTQFINQRHLQDLEEEGLIVNTAAQFSATEQGRKCLNAVLGHLI